MEPEDTDEPARDTHISLITAEDTTRVKLHDAAKAAKVCARKARQRSEDGGNAKSAN